MDEWVAAIATAAGLAVGEHNLYMKKFGMSEIECMDRAKQMCIEKNPSEGCDGWRQREKWKNLVCPMYDEKERAETIEANRNRVAIPGQ